MDQWVDINEDEWVDAPTDYISGVATTFGYNDSQDNGVGAWGTRTNNPDIVGVSLPIRFLREHFGDDDKAKDALVEVVNPATGKKIQAPIVDKGPADWVIARQGPTIDLTEGARRALGAGGKTAVQWKMIGHVPKDGWEAAPEEEQWTDAGHGAEVPKITEAAPKPAGPTYFPDDQLKGKTVKVKTTDPTSGESYEEETGAIEAQSFIKGNIDKYTMLMDCLNKS